MYSCVYIICYEHCVYFHQAIPTLSLHHPYISSFLICKKIPPSIHTLWYSLLKHSIHMGYIYLWKCYVHTSKIIIPSVGLSTDPETCSILSPDTLFVVLLPSPVASILEISICTVLICSENISWHCNYMCINDQLHVYVPIPV